MSLFALIAMYVTHAKADDPFTVSDIKVDVTADNAALARDKALIDGQRLAFQKLATTQNVAPPALSDDKIANLIKDFSVQNERASGTRYVATLTYRFRQGPTRSALMSAGANLPPTAGQQEQEFSSIISQTSTTTTTELLGGSATAARPLRAVIVPVYDRSRPLLWENPNPWRAAWQRILAQQGISNIAAPQGTIDDIQMLPADAAVSMDPAILNAFKTRYNAQAVWVFRAGVMQSPQGAPQLSVAFSRIDATGQSAIDTFALDGRNLGTQDQLFNAGVVEALKRMGVSASAPSMAAPTASSFVASVPIVGLQDVSNVQQKLLATGLFNRIDILAVSHQAVKLNIQSTVDPALLQTQLTQKNIQLLPVAGTNEFQLTFN